MSIIMHRADDCVVVVRWHSACDDCRPNRSAWTALPPGLFARPSCLTISCRSLMAAAMTTATSAAFAPIVTGPAPPSSSGCAAPSAPVRKGGRSSENPSSFKAGYNLKLTGRSPWHNSPRRAPLLCARSALSQSQGGSESRVTVDGAAHARADLK
jgi:hypothetical protein